MPMASTKLRTVTRLSLATWVAILGMKEVGSRILLLPLKTVQLRFLQGLVPIDRFHHYFNFLAQFPSESTNKIADQRHDLVLRG